MEHDERTTEAAADPRPAGEAAADPAVQQEGAAGAAPSDDGAPAEEAVQQDLDELQARAAERDEFLALAQRTQADFENFRRRAAREQGLAEQRGIAKVVRELLPALDNLERALAAAESQSTSPPTPEHHLAEGIRLVQAELLAAMARVGVEGYSPKGEVFDPNVHEAMAQQPVEGAEAGTVVEVYQQGYRIQGDVIRPARVIVAA